MTRARRRPTKPPVPVTRIDPKLWTRENVDAFNRLRVATGRPAPANGIYAPAPLPPWYTPCTAKPGCGRCWACRVARDGVEWWLR